MAYTQTDTYRHTTTHATIAYGEIYIVFLPGEYYEHALDYLKQNENKVAQRNTTNFVHKTTGL